MISYPVVVLDGALGRNGFMNVSGLNIYPNRSQFQQPTPPTKRTHIATVLLQPVTSTGSTLMATSETLPAVIRRELRRKRCREAVVRRYR